MYIIIQNYVTMCIYGPFGGAEHIYIYIMHVCMYIYIYMIDLVRIHIQYTV